MLMPEQYVYYGSVLGKSRCMVALISVAFGKEKGLLLKYEGCSCPRALTLERQRQPSPKASHINTLEKVDATKLNLV